MPPPVQPIQSRPPLTFSAGSSTPIRSVTRATNGGPRYACSFPSSRRCAHASHRQMARDTLHWDRPFHTVRSGSFENGDIVWFPEGGLNASYNCVDRWAYKYPNKVSLCCDAGANLIGLASGLLTFDGPLFDSRRPLFGKPTSRARVAKSPTANSFKRSARSPMSSRVWVSRRVTPSQSTSP